MVEAPLQAKAAHRVDGAGKGEDRRQGKPGIGMCLRKSRHDKGQQEAAENQHRAAQERLAAGVQEVSRVWADWKGDGDDSFSLVL
jgi:hypothetical protein